MVETRPEPHALRPATARTRLANGQEPFAAVLGCSDSRVPVERSSITSRATSSSFIAGNSSPTPPWGRSVRRRRTEPSRHGARALVVRCREGATQAVRRDVPGHIRPCDGERRQSDEGSGRRLLANATAENVRMTCALLASTILAETRATGRSRSSARCTTCTGKVTLSDGHMNGAV